MRHSRRKAIRLNRWAENPHCVYCRRRLRIDEATLDHVIPLSRGGRDVPANVVLACRDCNDAKGDRTATPKVLHLVSRPPRPKTRAAEN